jgi:hemoglobin
MTQATPYERLGGEAALRALVDRFYALMDILPQAQHIRAMHPPDITGSAQKLFMFLSGWLGGPPLFVNAYGHPRLRARHLPFAIDRAARDQWLLCMAHALDELVPDKPLRDGLFATLSDLADHMRNQAD